MRRRRYRLAFFGLLPLLALSVCATLAHVYVNSSLFQERLERELRTLFDGDVFSFRLLEVRPDLSVQLHDVSLRHPRTRRTLIHTRLVTARLTGGARDLARRHLALTDVYVSDPWVLLEFDEEGNLSLLDALGVTDEDEDEAPSDVRFDLSDVRVARGQLRIARPGFDLSVHHIDVDGFSLGVADDVTMQAQQVRVGGGGLRVEPAPGEPPVVVDWGAFVVDGFSWQKMAFSVAQVTGTVPGGRVSVKGSLQVEPELAFRVSGHVSGRGDMPVLRQFTGELLAVELEYAERDEDRREEDVAEGVDLAGLSLPDDLSAELLAAVKMHSMTRVQQQIEKLEQMGEAERQLAAQLRSSCRQYDMNGIKSVVTRICGVPGELVKQPSGT